MDAAFECNPAIRSGIDNLGPATLQLRLGIPGLVCPRQGPSEETHTMPYPTAFQVAVLILVALASQVPVWGQTALSEVTGEVTDPSGAPVANVTVIIVNTATGVRTSFASNEVGRFHTRALPPGTYDIQAEKPGFKTHRAAGLEIRTGQVLRYDLRLEVGDVATTVDVSAQTGAVEIQKDTAEKSIVFNQQVVQEMPKLTRRTLELIQLSPAVTMTEKGGWHTVYVPFFSTAGNPSQRSSMFYTDGTSTTFARAQGDGGGMSGLNPPPEAVSELRVVYNNYSAEFGEAMGSVLLMTTKSGTNNHHGVAYYYHQNHALDARTFFAGSRKNPNIFNNYGGTFGGPIVKNKTHYFVSLERESWIQKTPFVLTMPTLRQRRGDFSQTLNAAGNQIRIYDPATTRRDPATGNTIRDPFPGNIIPQGRFDPIVSRILNNYVADPNREGTITGANNFRADAKTRDLKHFWQFYRLDHQQTEKDRFYFRFTRDDVDPPFYGPYQGTKGEVADPYEEEYTSFGTTGGGSWTRLVSPSTLSDFKFGYTNFAVNRYAMGRNRQVWNQNWAGKLGLRNLGPDTFPRVDFAGYAPIGGGTWVQQLVYNAMRSWSFYETLSHQRGKHNFRVGGGWKHSKAVYSSRFWPSGRANFDTRATALPGVAATGNGVASGLLGEVASARVQESPAPDMRTWFATAFFQDDWRITRNLALNLGVRYEYDKPKVDVTEGASLFNFSKINPVCNCPGVVEFSINKWTKGRQHTPLYYQPTKNFAPRFGFAWTPFGRGDLVIRGGYGIFYIGGDYGDIFWDGPLLGRGTIQDWTSDALGTVPAFNFAQGFPQVPLQPLNDSWGAVPIGTLPRVDAKFFWYDRKPGYAQQFNLG
ncbi:MAG: TonB-dependent receptor, partial [Acidobacteria bacterium]|nr:TonB-dependent receptor [Acidobacteriota bacterium]